MALSYLNMPLKDNAFTGNRNQGNPFSDDLEKGVAYDTYEANATIIEQVGAFPRISSMYRVGASKLISHLSVKPEQKVLDMGSGTGISTLELLSQNPNVNVVGIEISDGMLAVARYKFNLTEGQEIISEVEDQKLLTYWKNFREESQKYSRQVRFLQDDFQSTDKINDGSLDAAIGNQFMHWTELSKTFSQLRRFLKNGSPVVWNSASHFYEDSQFPSFEYGFRYNDFLACVLNEVSKEVEVKDYKTLSRPEHTLQSIQRVSQEQGFDTQQVGTYLMPVDMQIFIRNHVPVFVRELVKEEIGTVKIEDITRRAVAIAINNPKALNDTTHKYDIVPVFESRKV